MLVSGGVIDDVVDLPPRSSSTCEVNFRLLHFFQATGVKRGHVGVADEDCVAFFGESFIVAVTGLATVPNAASLNGPFDLQNAVSDGVAGGET